MNAKLSKEDFNLFFHNETNRNGKLFQEVIEEYVLVTNTIFEKRNGEKWTITYPNKTKGQIDYIVINKK